MLKVSKKFSVNLSVCISVAFFIACAVCATVLPKVTDLIINTRNSLSPETISEASRNFILILAYMVIAVCMLADGVLLKLLLIVSKGAVFTKESVSLIRGVSWCCYLLGLVFVALGLYFYLSFMVAFAAIFLGLCLRIVKNVIEEATEIKSENDLTV